MQVRWKDGVLGLPSFPTPLGGRPVSSHTALLDFVESILPDLRSLYGPGEDLSEQKGIYPSRQRPYKSWWLKATIRQIYPRNLAHILTVNQGMISNSWASCG